MNDPSGNRYRYGCLALAALGGLLLLLLLWSCRLQPPFAPPPPAPAAAIAEADADAALGAAYPGLSFRHSRPLFVIPAKAGIHPRPTRSPGYAGVLDSGLRRNDGEGGAPGIRPSFVIPAKAGIHPPAYPQSGINRGSGFRPPPE